MAGQTALANGHDVYRLVFFLDRQCNGTAAAWLDIFETATYDSHRNLANNKRFKILKDITRGINATGGAGNGTTNQTVSTIHNIQVYLKCYYPIEYNNVLNTGALSTIRSNNIGWVGICLDGRSAVTGRFRVRYSD